MTKAVYLFLAGLTIACGIAACAKENNPGNTNTGKPGNSNPNLGRLVCKADGNDWVSDPANKLHKVLVEDSFIAFTLDIYGTECTLFGDTLSISGARVAGTDSSAIGITMVLTPDRIGSYTFGAYPPTKAGQAASFFYNKMGVKAVQYGYNGYNTTGSLEITSFNDSLGLCSGSFHFDMTPKNSSNSKTPPHSVKNGTFADVKLH